VKIRSKEEFASYVKNFIFGVEDSLVSTVGLLSGVAVAGLSSSDIFLTGIVLIFVEAFSMGVGSYLSEQSAEEFKKTKHPISVPGAFIMFFSYFLAGFIPLFPYVIFGVSTALIVSITVSILSLFVLGVISASIFKINKLKQGMRMLVIGGGAVLIGVIVGKIVV